MTSGATFRSRSDHERRDRALFDEIAATYCAKDLHPAARIARRQRLVRTLAAAPEGTGEDVLEVGCGAGFSAEYLKGRYRRFCGVDYSERLIEFARQFNGSEDARFEAVNIKDFAPDRPFDVVFMIGVLHHLDDAAAVMARLVEFLKPGGWLLANEPQPGNPLVRLARRVRKRMDATYSDEQCELSAAQLRALLEGAGLEELRIRPQGITSTPLAEVPMRPGWLWAPVASMACALDSLLERTMPGVLGRLSWNLVAAGRKPRRA